MLREHAGPLEADLARFYGLALTDLWAGALSFRRFSVLVMNLPAEAVTSSAIAGTPRGWTLTDTLLSDFYRVVTGEPHPLRDSADKRARAEAHHAKVARLEEFKRRHAARTQQEPDASEPK